MQRPTGTRRLSVATMASLLALALVASAGIRSFWTRDAITNHYGRAIFLEAGHLGYRQISGPLPRDMIPRARHISFRNSAVKALFSSRGLRMNEIR